MPPIKIYLLPPDFQRLSLIFIDWLRFAFLTGGIPAYILRSAFTASISAACVVSFSESAFMIRSSMVPFVMMCCTTTVSDACPCRHSLPPFAGIIPVTR